MQHKRPVNLDLMSLKFPPMAIASILHRISGILLFLLFPGLLYLLSLSLSSASGFQIAQTYLAHPLIKISTWAFMAALTYHFLAGLRHIVMDLGFGEGLPSGRYTALAVIVVSVILMIILGIWIW